MSIKTLIFYLISLLFFSCFKGNSNKQIVEGQEVSKKYLQKLPPFVSGLADLKDSLILGFNKGATTSDTSWVLLISKVNRNLRCDYIQLLPFSATGFDGFMDDSSSMLGYEGYTYEISNNQFQKIISLSGIEDYKRRDSVLIQGCLHCFEYSAYYDSQLLINSRGDRDFLIRLERILNDILIKPIFDKKQHPRLIFKKP